MRDDHEAEDPTVWRGKPGTPCEHAHDPGPLKMLSRYAGAYYVRCERCCAAGVVHIAVLHDVDESHGAWHRYDDS